MYTTIQQPFIKTLGKSTNNKVLVEMDEDFLEEYVKGYLKEYIEDMELKNSLNNDFEFLALNRKLEQKL